jgi:hypothetical protein
MNVFVNLLNICDYNITLSGLLSYGIVLVGYNPDIPSGLG